MKKTTVRSMAIGSIALTAAAAGAWLMLTSDPQKNVITRPTPPSSQPSSRSEGGQQQETNTASEPNSLREPVTQQTDPAEITQETSSTPHDLPPENTLETTTEGGEEQNIELEDTAKVEEGDKAKSGIPDAQTAPTEGPSPLAGDQQPGKSPEEKKSADMTEIPPVLTGEEKSQDIASPPQHQEREKSGPSCQEVSPILTHFFNKLEKKNYSKEESGTQPLQEHFNALAAQLLNNPPVVIHETDELYTVLTNTAHFFRILGKDNMRLLQKVLKQETADFENIAEEMHRLSTTEKQCVSGKKRLEIPFSAAYEYAGFFLNTLGGRSYLFRRDSGTRLLVNYYAVLILDQANKKQLNSYGLDISEQLPWLIQEMEANNRLTQKEKYLDKLYELAENYQALP